jgi:MYXO-CTERM domain-containing protein
MRALVLPSLVFLGSSLLPTVASAQTGCGGGYAGCASAPIHYEHREGLPVEFNFDTGWVPAGSPVQVRIETVLAGSTRVSLDGSLVGSWPEPMSLTAEPTAAGGALSVDYGLVFRARARLELDVGVAPVRWEGNLPYLPMIDFRAMSATTFQPWAWGRVSTMGRTMRQRVADISLTDAIIRIPGISGGFTLEATGEVEAGYRSTRFTFGGQADPITQGMLRTQAVFMAGSFVEYAPVLEGVLDYSVGVRLYPGLYVSLAGRRWTIGLPEIPVNVGPLPRDLRFDPSLARLGLPDIQSDMATVDFGEVTLGRSTERDVTLRNVGEGDGRLLSIAGDGPFTSPTSSRPLPVSSRSTVVVTFMPVRPGPAEGTMVITTNDPDNPRVRVAVRGVGVAPPVVVVDAGAAVEVDAGGGVVAEDGGVPPALTGTDDGGCGCSVPGPTRKGPGWMAALLGFGVWGAARRSRRGSARRRKKEESP